MENENGAFDKGQFTGEQCIEDDGEAGDCNDEESSVPSFGDVGGVVKDDQALDLPAC